MKNQIVLFSIFLLFVVGCKKDPEPEACFSEKVSDVKVNFDGGCSKDADSYFWDFGDNKTSEVKNPVHTYSKVGTYTVTLRVTNKEGSDEISRDISLEQKCSECTCKTRDTGDIVFSKRFCGSASEVADFQAGQRASCEALGHHPTCEN